MSLWKITGKTFKGKAVRMNGDVLQSILDESEGGVVWSVKEVELWSEGKEMKKVFKW